MTSEPLPPAAGALGFRTRFLGATATAVSVPPSSPGLRPGSVAWLTPAFLFFTASFLAATYQSFVKRRESASLPSRTRLRKPDDLRRHLRRRPAVGVHLRLAFLGEDHGDRLPLAPRQDRIDVHECRVQLLRRQAAYGGLARSRQPDQHDVPLHASPPDPLSAVRRGGTGEPVGVLERTWAR